VLLLGQLYEGMAIWLNNLENHRTDTLYEDALIAKTFVFQFVNSYGSMFYIAFVKGMSIWNQYGVNLNCLNDDCLDELRNALRTIFVTRLFVGNVQELGIPYAQSRYRQWRETGGPKKAKAGKKEKGAKGDEAPDLPASDPNVLNKKMSPVELQYFKGVYDSKVRGMRINSQTSCGES
jgi:hypothetical protein